MNLFHMQLDIQWAVWAFVLAVLFLAAFTDLKDRIIPDELVGIVALCGLVLCLAGRPGPVWLSLLTAAAVFLALAVLCRYGMVGGGDVKLIAALALLARPDRVGELLIEIALAGGVLSCVYLGASFMRRGAPKTQGVTEFNAESSAPLPTWIEVESARIASRKQVPYALAILGGVLWHVARGLQQCSFVTPCSF